MKEFIFVTWTGVFQRREIKESKIEKYKEYYKGDVVKGRWWDEKGKLIGKKESIPKYKWNFLMWLESKVVERKIHSGEITKELAPIPCKKRKINSWLKSLAKAHKKPAIPNSMSVGKRIFFLPSRSAKIPKTGDNKTLGKVNIVIRRPTA